MARRETVSVDCRAVLYFVQQLGRNKTWLSRELGKYDQWWVNVERGKNLPSPEEAARMCAILNAQPEDFIDNDDDIRKVRELIEEEKPRSLIDKYGLPHGDMDALFEAMHKNPKLGVLFSRSAKMNEDDVEKVLQLLDIIKGNDDD